MKSDCVSLNDLPQWSPWPSRLLGISGWEIPNRTVEKIDLEYDKTKYAESLAYYMETPSPVSIETIKQVEINSASLCISVGNDLVLMTRSEAQSIYDSLLLDTMRNEIEQSRTVVELGCGYGYNLWMLKQHFADKVFLGADYSANAVLLASKVLRKHSGLTVSHFNFYDPTYSILKRVRSPATIFTSHAIEQLPKSAPFFQGLSHYKAKIKTVFHFEPVYELHDSTLLGLMRRRYAEVNDYNRDLLSELERWSDHIRIVQSKPDVLGMNPLNATSLIQWNFT